MKFMGCFFSPLPIMILPKIAGLRKAFEKLELTSEVLEHLKKKIENKNYTFMAITGRAVKDRGKWEKSQTHVV